MFGLFKKKTNGEVRNARIVDPLVHYVFERKRLPDEGASSYAFETLQLVVYSPIDRAVRVRKPIGVALPDKATGQLFVSNMATTDGIPSMAGGFYGGRQYTSDGVMAALGTSDYVNPMALRWNNPGTDASNPMDSNNPFPFNHGAL
jgi:hypothetical protein